MTGMEIALALGSVIVIALIIGLVLALQRIRVQAGENGALRAKLERFRVITDIEAELARRRAEASAEQQRVTIELANQRASQQQEMVALWHASQHELAQASQQLSALRAEGMALEQRVVALRHEVAHLDDQAMFAEHGLFRPLFEVETSESYRRQIERIREQQKQLVKDGLAAICRTTWTVEGNAAKGRKMVADQLKLALRAFNGECDAVVAKVRYDNYHSLAKRVEKAFETINKLVAVNQCEITPSYLRTKQEELRLTHAYQEQLQAEREEQRAIRERLRDEQLAAKELEKAERDAAREEARLADLIARAQEQADKAAAGAKHDQLVNKIAELERQLAVAAEQRQRALSLAQQTRAGHVYIISNIGSFGEDVYKVGMTRRYDPLDRVKELGDASVPFRFDVHGLIYTDDAPALEATLHRALAPYQVNLVNNRKEFFRVPLALIEQLVAKHHGRVELTRWPEAEEYRKTEALRSAQAS